MLRITELRLPLGHALDALPAAIVAMLGIEATDLLSFRIARRANDARKKSAIVMVYSVDVALADEERVLDRTHGDVRVRRPPDTEYRFVAATAIDGPVTDAITTAAKSDSTTETTGTMSEGSAATTTGASIAATPTSSTSLLVARKERAVTDATEAERTAPGDTSSTRIATVGAVAKSIATTHDASDEPATAAPDTVAIAAAEPITTTTGTAAGNPATVTRQRPIVIGAGPCGLFCALILAQMGLRPIVLERGKVVRERTQDTWGLWRRRELNPESNVQFGEGGAGTFSDGKLWSQIKDPRHLGRKVLNELVLAGAPAEILVEAHPHVGTFRLVSVVENLRRTIEGLGGEYRFGQRVDDFDVSVDPRGARTLRGLHFADGSYLATERVVLAVGHSARDTFEALHRRNVDMVAKPFSIGVRIEHPQSWIDRARYGPGAGHPDLGAAAYALSHHCTGPNTRGRTVYSFCMCPGGTVVAAASEPGRLVVNGMSQYSRNERNANSGLVVGIDPAHDFPGGPLAGIALQRHWESRAFEAGGGAYEAPAQTVGDFVAGRASTQLGEVVPSYKPGVQPTDLARCLPGFVIESIREALPVFGRQIKGYDHPDVVLTGIEARTSSPVRINRGVDCQSLNTAGLYPAGEGAGYAGGILSAAVDGIRVAEAIALEMAGPVTR